MAFLRVKNTLKSIFICKGCVSGPLIIEAESHINITKPDIAVGLPLNITNYLKADVCELCMGLNQLIRTDSFLADLDKDIEYNAYEFRSFNFNFRMPLSLKIRQAYVRDLVNKDLIEYDDDIKKDDFNVAINADLKNQIKQFLNIRYTKKFNASVDNTDDFAIVLEFFNNKDEQDMVNL